MSLEPVIQSDISQKEKNKYCTITCVCGIYKNGTDEPICGQEYRFSIKNRLVDTALEGKSGTD